MKTTKLINSLRSSYVRIRQTTAYHGVVRYFTIRPRTITWLNIDNVIQNDKNLKENTIQSN